VPLPQSKQQKQKQANGVVGSEAAVKEDEEEVSDKGSDSEEEETNRESRNKLYTNSKLILDKGARILNGEWRVTSINGVGKTGCPHTKFYTIHKN